MAKEKAVKETKEKEITFTCRFCGETKPFSEMVIQTRYFPLLTSCRVCDTAMQNIKLEEIPEEAEEEEDSAETDEEKPE
jgi:hypothetical protein